MFLNFQAVRLLGQPRIQEASPQNCLARRRVVHSVSDKANQYHNPINQSINQ